MKKVLSTLLVLILILGGGGYLLATAADASTPGDTLYAVDTLAESVQRAITFDPIAKAELEQAILDERASEVLEILEAEDTDEAVLGEAVDNLDAQNTRVQERIQLLADEEGNIDEAALERVQNRYEEQVAEQVKNMEKVQSQYKNMGEETMNKFQTAEKEINGNANGSVEQNSGDTGNSNAGDNGNSESNGNTDSGSSNSNGGSTNGNGNN